jgi:hypothetical protein
MSTLGVRASIPFRIETSYDPNDQSKRSILFRGYAQRTDGTQKGTPGRVYPSPNWREYEITGTGMWMRLQTTLIPNRWLLWSPDTFLPYAISDSIRASLNWAGLSNDMLDIFPSPITFFPSPGLQHPDLTVEIGTTVSQFIEDSLTKYTNWYMVFEPNAGPRGMWRTRTLPTPPYTNLWSFVTSTPAGKLTGHPGSYGTNTSFIRHGTFRSYVIPPAANAIRVVGLDDPSNDGQHQITRWALNYNSASFSPAHPASPTLNPDYLGYLLETIVVDPTLWGEKAVNWVTRRLFDNLCHGYLVYEFDAPLALMVDPTDFIADPNNPYYLTKFYNPVNQTYFAAPRPLRYGDPVLLNGLQFMVRSCNPFCHRLTQWAHYEVISMPAGATVTTMPSE